MSAPPDPRDTPDEPDWDGLPDPPWPSDDDFAPPPPPDAAGVRRFTVKQGGGGLSRQELRAAQLAKHQERQVVATRIASRYDGVLTRQMLVAVGISQGQINVELSRGAWHRIGCHTISVVGPEVNERARLWWAIWESTRSSVLDGVTALIAAGLTGWTEPVLHVSVPNNVPVRDLPGVRHHRSRAVGRFIDGLRRTPPVTATIRAAQWAPTDRSAATIVAMSVQQRLVRPDDLLKEWDAVGYSHRREALDGIIKDVCDGAQSLGEIDFARKCRARGIPEPSRQVLRNDGRGHVYLDVYWDDCDVHVEINGAQHYQGTARIDDALRSNALAIGRADVISLDVPVLALIACEEVVMAQVEAARAEGLRRRALREAS